MRTPGSVNSRMTIAHNLGSWWQGCAWFGQRRRSIESDDKLRQVPF
jgi:hypothetical protein